MMLVVDNELRLEKNKRYYRTVDILQRTGWTTDELKRRMEEGKFPQYISVIHAAWPKQIVDICLKDGGWSHARNKKH